MKVTYSPKVTATDFPAAAGFTSRFISNFSAMVAQVFQVLSGGLTFADNFNSVWLTETAKHNTALTVANPLRNASVPKAVIVTGAATNPVKSSYASYSASTKQITLTVNYDLVSPDGVSDTVTVLVVAG